MLIGGKEAGASGGIKFSNREYSFLLRTSETAEMRCPQEIPNRCGDRNGWKDVHTYSLGMKGSMPGLICHAASKFAYVEYNIYHLGKCLNGGD